MNIPFELHIALRYLLAKRKQAFISVISLISTLGVTVGVMALVIGLAVMTGFQQELSQRIIGASPHIFVFKRSGIADYATESAKLRGLPHVVGAAPAILGKALISVAGEQAFINVKGIDPVLEPAVTDIAGAMRSGALTDLRSSDPNQVDAILLGTELAAQLGVAVGDSISVLTLQGTLSPMGMIPRPRRLRVAGTFNLGLTEIDSATGLVSLALAERLLDKDEVDTIQLRLDDIYAAPALADSIPQKFGDDYVAQDWADLNRTLFSALALERIIVSLTIFLIVMVAALNIVASLILLVMEKHRDIAILKTMGASRRSVTIVFMLQGLIIGTIGTTVGAAFGWSVSRIFDRYQLISLPADVYQLSHVPFDVVPLHVVTVVVAAILVCFVATIYPSRQAARLDPAQALRYE
jgi:lipoprotein-releasing system permease protein